LMAMTVIVTVMSVVTVKYTTYLMRRSSCDAD